ncbi:alpha-2-macroglobulin family protein [Kordia zhangzhouensis]|uniref:alpha-2-macroglobulin family protein n=1 Tax=Kordia zhangzhouensis TaxID=1620405 RepID=UPI000629099A|nr:MG2 domain-containing protein [Kordia zhangzhouensis]
MRYTTIFIISWVFIALFSCKKEQPETDNIFEFKDYVYQTTAGTVSVNEPIIIGLQKEVPQWKNDQEVSTELIRISPKIEGKLQVQNNKTLRFIPNNSLQPNTEYSVTIHLKDIYKDIPKEFNSYTFAFKTITPNFTIATNDLQSHSKEWQYLNGMLRSADIIPSEKLESLLKVMQSGKALPVRWNTSSQLSRTSYEFTIDSINRLENDSEIEISWTGKPIDADTEGSKTFNIPGQNNFSVVDITVTQNPEQKISINFSDPLLKNQNFEGLVDLKNQKNITYAVDGNILNVYPTNRITGSTTLEVFPGIKNKEGYTLKKNFTESISFEQLKPQVREVSKGVILPNSKNLTYNFQAVNLNAVDVRIIKIYEDNVLQFLQENHLGNTDRYSIRQVGRRVAKQTIDLIKNNAQNDGQWKTYGIDLSKFFKAEPGAIYQVEISFKKEYSLFTCEEGEVSEVETDTYRDDYYQNPEEEEENEEEYWDNRIYNFRNYRYNWRDRDNPCTDSYYLQNRFLTTNILASDLGVIAKRGENKSYYFAVSDIVTTNPVVGAKVTLYNYQQQEIAFKRTDADGLTIIDADKNAYFAAVSKNNQFTYVKLNDGSSLSLSKFDVSGKKINKGINGYIYGERGVWRPGDTLHLAFVLNDKGNPLPKDHPVKMEVTDARGKLVYKKIQTQGIDNFYKFTVPTATEAPTGNWFATVSVGGAQFSKTLKVETVKPNRLKINIDFEDEILSSSETVQGTLKATWLHGAPAKNLKAEVNVRLTSTNTTFKKFPAYEFNDPTRTFNAEEFVMFKGTLNEEGLAQITKKISVDKSAPGMLRASFLTRVFENGGDFSIDAFSKNLAPYASFVGLKSPEPKRYGSFYTDENNVFEVITVDDKGNPIKRNGLEVKIYEINWRWWWSSSYEDLSSYSGSDYHEHYKTITINTDSNGKGNFTINIPDEERGRYLIRVYDPKSGHATGRTAYFYKNWWRKANDGNAETAKMLLFSADKTNYNVGETATITFPSGKGGRALISVENGTEVLSTKWVKTEKEQTTTTIPITKEMAPNVFVNISLVQKHDNVSNDLPIRLYGIIPIMVEDPSTILQPKISMPETLRPEETFTVKVSEENNKAMTYTIAMVDEGLLDLTRFKTPNPWDIFYQRQALGVRTWDIYDDIIGAFSGEIDQVFAIGGGDDGNGSKNKKANRFKPVVKYLGPFTLKAGETKSHKIEMPNYIGAVRTMVVAGNPSTEAYGSAEKSSQVKKPLMVLATVPRKLSPGEKVTLPVTVFAMENKVKNVNVQLKLQNGISVAGSNSQSVSFAKPDEKMLFFELDVAEVKGIQTIEVLASGNGEKASYKVELDVENTNPIAKKVHELTLDGKTAKTLDFDTFGVLGTNVATVEFSTLPPMDFTSRMDYLIRYPHGCIEQTTSSVFPQLYLNDIFDLTSSKKQQIQNNIEKGIKRLAHFQRPNGGLSYWIGERSADDWGTCYAGHFMIEAEKKGYTLPLTFMSQWINYQKNAARTWRNDDNRYYYSDLTQAYRLYTLALAGHPDLPSMNRLRESKNLSNDAKWRLAAAYALASQKEAALQIANSANINFIPANGRYDYTYGSVDRNRAMAMETLVILNDKKAVDLAKIIAKDLSSNRWMSTQTTAYCLLAMGKMVQQNGGKNIKMQFSTNGQKAEEIVTTKTIAQRELAIKTGTNTLQIENKEDNVLFVRVLNTGKLPFGEELAEKRNLSIRITYKDKLGNAIDVSKLQQGTDFMASVTISNDQSVYVGDIALTEIFPSGWEIVNTRFTDYGNTPSSEARHTDIRDDRVNFYFDLPQGKSKTFNVLLNASYLGKYYLPGVQAEAMYDNDYFIRTKGQWIEVVK